MKYKFTQSFTTPFFTIEEGSQEEIDSSITTNLPYYRLTTPDSVICCVLNKQAEFILVNQFRPNIGTTTLELPAGSISDHESPLDAAKREFEEETAMTCKFLPLGDFHLMMNRINSKEFIFFGFDPEDISNRLPEEGVSVKKIQRQDLLNSTLSGEYKQIAGLGVIQVTSLVLGLDILTADIGDISDTFFKKLDNN